MPWTKEESAPESDYSNHVPTLLLGNPQEFYIMFTRSHISPRGPVDSALLELQLGDVDKLASPRTLDLQKTHLQAVLSFATIFFGMKHNSQTVTKQGLISHGATLKQLNRALSNPRCYMYDQVVVSMTTLAMQEMFVPSAPKAYVNHMLGLEKILMLRDTTSHCAPSTVSLYKCLRHMMLFAALCERRPSILARPEWKALLMQYCESAEERQEQQLYDALADCSVLYAEMNDVLTNPGSPGEEEEHQVIEVRRKARILLAELQAWKEHRNVNPSNAHLDALPCWVFLQSVKTELVGEPLPISTDLEYSSIHAALIMMLYNTALMYVLHMLVKLPTEPDSPRSKQDYMGMIHLAVVQIYRSMPEPADMHASPVNHWAVHVAYMVLRDDLSKEGRWLVSLLDRKTVATRTKDMYLKYV